MLDVRDIHVRRGNVDVLHGVSLQVGEGEILTLLGGNGVGKSTTLRSITGLNPPHAGSIHVNDRRTDGLRPPAITAAGVAHVPEGRQLFPDLSVVENLEMGAYLRDDDLSEDLEHVFELFPDLDRVRSARAGNLSGGQQQMLAIGRGLMSRPRLLLLDEPSLGLAPLLVKRIGDVIREIRATGASVFLVEQNATLALGVADRGLVMTGGRIILEGTPDELRNDDRVRSAYLGG
ncbi:MAG: ABC transporter ATP-binding protein [Actinobacteria bacterium]|nr:ABC transporter ATP-binding protein [Actinomycetota bacterium]